MEDEELNPVHGDAMLMAIVTYFGVRMLLLESKAQINRALACASLALVFYWRTEEPLIPIALGAYALFNAVLSIIGRVGAFNGEGADYVINKVAEYADQLVEAYAETED